MFEVDDRVSFIDGALGHVATPVADAYYLYNPFGRYTFGSKGDLDTNVEFSDERCARDVAAVEDLLQRARVGTCLLTYNGFGGRVPASYRQIRVDRTMPAVLRLWRKEGGKPLNRPLGGHPSCVEA